MDRTQEATPAIQLSSPTKSVVTRGGDNALWIPEATRPRVGTLFSADPGGREIGTAGRPKRDILLNHGD